MENEQFQEEVLSYLNAIIEKLPEPTKESLAEFVAQFMCRMSEGMPSTSGAALAMNPHTLRMVRTFVPHVFDPISRSGEVVNGFKVRGWIWNVVVIEQPDLEDFEFKYYERT